MAVWVELNRNFDWFEPTTEDIASRVMKAFPVGEHFVTEEQAVEIERVGAGKRITKPDGKKVSKSGQAKDAD